MKDREKREMPKRKKGKALRRISAKLKNARLYGDITNDPKAPYLILAKRLGEPDEARIVVQGLLYSRDGLLALQGVVKELLSVTPEEIQKAREIMSKEA